MIGALIAFHFIWQSIEKNGGIKMIYKIIKNTVHQTVAAIAAVSMALCAIPGISFAAEPVNEKAQILKLYEQAKTEKGALTVYMGGDAPGQWDEILKGFSDQFPDIKLNAVVDLSKYHEPRIQSTELKQSMVKLRP